jgi:DNA-binding CsgD family transcriptional regulator
MGTAQGMEGKLLEALRGLYVLKDLKAYPTHALEVCESLIPISQCSWIKVDCKKKLLMEVASLGVLRSTVSAVQRACEDLFEQHPCYSQIEDKPNGCHVMQLSALIEFSKWQMTEFYKIAHEPNGIRDVLIGVCKRPDHTCCISLASKSVFTKADADLLREMLPHIEVGWLNACEYSKSQPSQRPVGARFLVPLARDGSEEKWPPSVVAVLCAHSQAPVLTFRQPLPQDFIKWLNQARAVNLSKGDKSQLVEPYTAQGTESRLTARLIPPTGILDACIAIEVSAIQSTSSHLTAHGLSPRECEVAYWISQGKRNEAIGLILGCETSTVRKHVQTIFDKLGVESRIAVAALALGRSEK